MGVRHVLVVSRQALFREGLRRLLSGLSDINLLDAVGSLAEAEALVANVPPDVIVVNREDESTVDQTILASLLDMTEAQVVTVTLADRGLTVYSRQHVPEASVQDLLDVLKNA